jgi:hypothetical protein
MRKPESVEEVELGKHHEASRARTALGALLGAAAIGAVWLVTALAAPRLVPLANPVPTLSARGDIESEAGDLKVTYMVEDSPTEASGGVLDDVTAIELHPAYIVVKQKSGYGHIFFPERTRTLNWTR